MSVCATENSTTEDYETQQPLFRLSKAGVCVEAHSKCFNTPGLCDISHLSFFIHEKKNCIESYENVHLPLQFCASIWTIVR